MISKHSTAGKVWIILLQAIASLSTSDTKYLNLLSGYEANNRASYRPSDALLAEIISFHYASESPAWKAQQQN